MINRKTPITWYGGKQGMLKYILPIIPEHRTYTEAFFGGGALFFAKDPSRSEVINDLNKEAVNFYKTTQGQFDQLQYEVTTTLHSKDAYNDARVIYTNPHLFEDVKRAWAFYTLTSQSFSSGMTSFAFDRVGTTALKVLNKRAQFVDQIRERLSRATIENDDAVKVINRYDHDQAFHYVDPPYFNSNCGHYSGYTELDFRRLLDTLSQVKGKFLLSSYPSSALEEFTKGNGWHQVKIDKKIAVSKNSKGTKTEVLTANYPIRLPLQV